MCVIPFLQQNNHAEHDYIAQGNNSHISVSATTATFPETPQSSKKGKRLTKTTRLSHSIKNNEHFLKINEEKASVDKKYKEEKLDIMKKEFENRKNYYQQKTVLLQQIAEELHLIRVGLNQK